MSQIAAGKKDAQVMSGYSLAKSYGCLLLLLIVTSCLFPVFGQDIEGEKPDLSKYSILEADIREVFRSLAELGEYNILLDPAVKGKVTLRFRKGLSIKEAVELLAEIYGYSCRWVGSRTVIVGHAGSLDALNEEETRVYELNYVRAEEMIEALKVVVPTDRIGIDKGTNQLTVRGSTLVHQNIEEIIKSLDREMPQYVIEARMEEVSKSASRELGIDWIFDFSIDSNLRFNLTTLQKLKALEEENKARLLVSSNISTDDGKEGTIFIGDQYPVVFTRITEKGVEELVEYKKIGVNLHVLPRMNEKNIMTVTVRAEVSSIVDWKKTANGNDIPVIKTSQVSSVKRMKEGETCILSGFNLVKEEDNLRAVPVLSKLPLIGSLFRTKEEGLGEESQVCIFLTPKIVEFKKEVTIEERINSLPEVVSNSDQDSEKRGEETTGTLSSLEPEITTEIVSIIPGDSNGTTVNDQSGADRTETSTDDVVTPESPKATVTEESVGIPEVPDIEITILDPSDKETVKPSGEGQSQSPEATVDGSAAGKKATVPEDIGLMITYNVKKGDTVFAVARKYGITPESILQENGLTTSSLLSVGQNLTVPIPVSHLYQLNPGETLWRVARRYGIEVELLKEINNIYDATALKAGQIIILPVPVDRKINSEF